MLLGNNVIYFFGFCFYNCWRLLINGNGIIAGDGICPNTSHTQATTSHFSDQNQNLRLHQNQNLGYLKLDPDLAGLPGLHLGTGIGLRLLGCLG